MYMCSLASAFYNMHVLWDTLEDVNVFFGHFVDVSVSRATFLEVKVLAGHIWSCKCVGVLHSGT